MELVCVRVMLQWVMVRVAVRVRVRVMVRVVVMVRVAVHVKVGREYMIITNIMS